MGTSYVLYDKDVELSIDEMSNRLQLTMWNKCCDDSKHKSILQFHHTDREVKSFSINGSRLANRSMKKINEEIDKCVLLCPNCHAEVHMNDGNHQGDKINRQGG